MKISEQPKFDYEIATCNTFLTIYDKTISIIGHGNPHSNEPDFICTNNIEIEIVGIYDNEKQAKELWNKEKIKKSPKDDFELYSFENLYKQIQEKLLKLNNGLYDGFQGKKILLCDMLSPKLTTKDINKYKKLYITFKSEYKFTKYFDEIWVLWKLQTKNQYRITRLE